MTTRRPRRKATWMEISVKHAAFRGAITALKWAYSWGIAREALGHEPTVDEVADWWRMSRRTAFRAQAAFREAFPDFETPSPLCENFETRQAMRLKAENSEDSRRGSIPRMKLTDSDILWLGQRSSNLPLDEAI